MAHSSTLGLGRRSLLCRAAAGVLASGIGVTSRPARAQAITDSDLLNFLLNIEYLEAEYYLRAVTGQGLALRDTTGVPSASPYNVGGVRGGVSVPFRSAAIAQYAQVLAVDQQAHVRFLRAVLGTAAVTEPTIDLTVFTQFAFSAGLITAEQIINPQSFNPFADDVSFLLGAFIFEDVGVTAYAGAMRLIQNKDNVEAVAGLLATEAYHAGAVRTLLANLGGGAALNAIATYRAKLSNAADDFGTNAQGTAYNFTNTDSNALTFRRSSSQALNVLYNGGNDLGFCPGSALCGSIYKAGFFPFGVNGTIQ